MGKGSRQRRNREAPGRAPQRASSSVAVPAAAEAFFAAKPPEHRDASKAPRSFSHTSQGAPRVKRRQERIATVAGRPRRPTPSHEVASAKVASNKYALLELLDDEFEEVRQK